MTTDYSDSNIQYSDALAIVANGLGVEELLLEHADAVVLSLQELSAWMRSHCGPKDGVHEMLIRAVEALQNAGSELDTPTGRELCAECGKNPADSPSSLCTGCEAYREHTAV